MFIMFMRHYSLNCTVATAHYRTLSYIAINVANSYYQGKSLDNELRNYGLSDIDTLVTLIQNENEYTKSTSAIWDAHLTEVPHNALLQLGCFLVVTLGGGVGGIPSAACIDSHLPKNRRPTEEELRKAWEACIKG